MDETNEPVVVEGHGAALIAGFLGWTLDAFDFFLVGLSLTAIAAEFHKTDAEIALSISLTLAFRPVGAFIFGLLADRYGRRLPLIIDLIFYSLVEVLSGLAPNYLTFMALRALFGIGMGGEWASERLWRWRKFRRVCGECSRDFCRRDMRPVTCWPRVATFSSFHVGDGGRCSLSVVCPRYWRFLFGFESKNQKFGRRPGTKRGVNSAGALLRIGNCSSIWCC